MTIKKSDKLIAKKLTSYSKSLHKKYPRNIQKQAMEFTKYYEQVAKPKKKNWIKKILPF